jgi:hypothetical protein
MSFTLISKHHVPSLYYMTQGNGGKDDGKGWNYDHGPPHTTKHRHYGPPPQMKSYPPSHAAKKHAEKGGSGERVSETFVDTKKVTTNHRHWVPPSKMKNAPTSHVTKPPPEKGGSGERVAETVVTTQTVRRTDIAHNNYYGPSDEVKQGIADRLEKKFQEEQKKRKQEYDENTFDDDTNDEGAMLRECGAWEFDGPYGEHPIEWETWQTLTLIRALPNLEIPTVRGQCLCPLSRNYSSFRWLKRNGVSDGLESSYHCDSMTFNDQQSFLNHICGYGNGKNIGHRLVHDYIQEVMNA